jgi:MinD-like ATPase involved in chromosome partitioning or flagellar assembly
MKISVDAMIPSSRLVPTSLNKGRPVVLDEPGSAVSQSIHNLAIRLTGAVEAGASADLDSAAEPRRKKGLFARMKS